MLHFAQYRAHVLHDDRSLIPENELSLAAPVHIGDVVIHNVLGLNSDVIVTKHIDKA